MDKQMSAPQKRTLLQIISTGGLYGAERALLEIASYMRDQDWNTHIVALEGRGATALVKRAGEMNLSAEAFPGDRVDFRTMAKQLGAIAGQFSPGVIHSHGYKPDILLALTGFSRKWIRVSTCHTWYRETWKMRLWEYVDKRVLRNFDAVVPVSGTLQEELLASGVRPELITRVDNGIDAPGHNAAECAAIRSEFGLSPEDKVIVQIGRLTRSKRNDLMIEALSDLLRHLPAHLIFVGDGEERDMLAKLCADKQISERVHFTGYRTDAPRFLSAANVLAITSDHEGLPIVLLEAMAAGCPIVATKVGAIPDVLADGVSAWLVQPGNAASFSAALADAIASGAQAAARATQARHTFELRHSRKAMGEKYREVYERAWRKRQFPN